MNRITNISIRWLNYEFHNKRPMQMIEPKLKTIIWENPQLKITLDRSINYSSIGK